MAKHNCHIMSIKRSINYWDYLPSVLLCSRWKRSPARPCSEKKKTYVRLSQTCNLIKTQQKTATTENVCMHTFFSFVKSATNSVNWTLKTRSIDNSLWQYFEQDNFSSSWLNDNWLLWWRFEIWWCESMWYEHWSTCISLDTWKNAKNEGFNVELFEIWCGQMWNGMRTSCVLIANLQCRHLQPADSGPHTDANVMSSVQKQNRSVFNTFLTLTLTHNVNVSAEYDLPSCSLHSS